MCDACSHYEKQSAFIEKGIAIRQEKELTSDELEQLKQTITQKLKDSK